MAVEPHPSFAHNFNHVVIGMLNSCVKPDKKYEALLGIANVVDNFCTEDMKATLIRKLMLNALNNPQFEDGEQVGPLMNCYKIMSKYSSSMTPIEFMEKLNATYHEYWQYYAVFGEILVEQGKQNEVVKLFKSCLANCGISRDELVKKLSPNLAGYVTNDSGEPTILEKASTPDDELTSVLFNGHVHNKIDIPYSNDSMNISYDLPIRAVENSFILGTPKTVRQTRVVHMNGVKFLDLLSVPHIDLQGVFSLIGYHLTRILIGGKLKGILEPRRLYFNSKINKKATFGELMKQDILSVLDDPEYLNADNKGAIVEGYLSCVHFLMFGCPLKSKMFKKKLMLWGHYIKSTWSDGILWQSIFDELLNSNGEVNWNSISLKLQQYIQDAIDFEIPEYMESIEEFNRLFEKF